MAIIPTPSVIQMLSGFRKELTEAILAHAQIAQFKTGETLVHFGQQIRYIPLVISGHIKVQTHQEEKELLLYFIQARESCIMSFASGISHQPSTISAVAEEETEVILIPCELAEKWANTFPEFNQLFLQQYHKRYVDLIHTIQHLLYETLDERLYQYLKDTAKRTQTKKIMLSHRQIASDLGTAREVISRLIKKLEKQQLLKQLHPQGIELFFE